jgi:transcriptional regulator with PAS, ATPase and Fis domain
LKEKSNFSTIYESDEFQEFQLDVNDLRDVQSIVNALKDFVKENLSTDDNCIVNISLGSAETEVAWFILADNGILPHNTKFIQTYDDKSTPSKRFKQFCIKQVPVKLINDVRKSFEFYKGTKSKKRELATKLFDKYLESGFPVLLLGERGTGKSHLVANSKKDNKGEIVEANCASFTDNTIAESELFGYAKGTFTGGEKNGKVGLIQSAENGVLFLDEIHHLSKYMQAKLMKAFQTDTENNFHIRPVGSAKELPVKNVKLVFATNHTIEQLKNDLLPDFYDRIVQYVVEIPPLRETKEDLKKDIENVWKYLYPNEEDSITIPKELLKWVMSLELRGNYRDLQNIVRYYKIFNEFDEKTKKEICNQYNIKCSALDYAKECFEKYHLVSDGKEKITVDIDLSDSKNIKNSVLSQFANWAIEKFGSRKNAAKELDITEKTLYNWKNGNNNAHKTS